MCVFQKPRHTGVRLDTRPEVAYSALRAEGFKGAEDRLRQGFNSVRLHRGNGPIVVGTLKKCTQARHRWHLDNR